MPCQVGCLWFRGGQAINSSMQTSAQHRHTLPQDHCKRLCLVQTSGLGRLPKLQHRPRHRRTQLLQAGCMLWRQRVLSTLGTLHGVGSGRLVGDGGGWGPQHLRCSHERHITPATLRPAAGKQPIKVQGCLQSPTKYRLSAKFVERGLALLG